MEAGREFHEKMKVAKAAKAAARASEGESGNGSAEVERARAPEPDNTPEVRVSVRPARRAPPAGAPGSAPSPPVEESPLDWDDGTGIEIERIGSGRGPGWRKRLGKVYYRGIEVELTRVGRLRPSPRLFDETEELAGGGTYKFTGRGRDGKLREVVKTLKGAPKSLTPESEEAAEEAAEEEALYGHEPQGAGAPEWWSGSMGAQGPLDWGWSPLRGHYWPHPGPPIGAPPGVGSMVQPDEGLRRENEELRRKLDREEFQRKLDERIGTAGRPDPLGSYVDLMRAQAERTENERHERWDQWERDRREAQDRHQEEVRLERERRGQEREEERAQYERDHDRRIEEAKLERERQDRFFETLIKLQESGGGKSSVASAIKDVVQGAIAMRDLSGSGAEHPGAAAREVVEAVGATIKDAAPALAGAFVDVWRAFQVSRYEQRPQQIQAQVQSVTPSPTMPPSPPPALTGPGGPRKPTPADWLRITQVLVLKGVRPKNAPASMVPYLAGVCEQAGIDTAAVIADLRGETAETIVVKLKLSEASVPDAIKPAVADLVKDLDTPEGREWLGKFLEAVKESS